MKVLSSYNKFLEYIDNGNFFRAPVKWLYVLNAVLNFLVPFYLLVWMIDNRIFDGPGKLVIAAILVWIVLLVGFVLLGLLWWNRKRQIDGTRGNDNFPVTPIFAHIIRTYGEWLGILIGGLCTVVVLIALIFLGSEAQYFLSDVPLAESGVLSLVMLPIVGFLIIIFSRFISEQVRVFVQIAHNTKK